MSTYISLALAAALAIAIALAGVFAYRYKDAQKSLDSALEANKLYAAAIDRLTVQRKVDDKMVVAFQQGLADLDARSAETAAAVKALNDDPTSKTYLDTPLPDAVKRVLNGSAK